MPAALRIEHDVVEQGRRIRELRQAHTISQQHLAEAIERFSNGRLVVNQSSVSRWESGAVVALRYRKTVAKVLGTTVDDLWPPSH